jgi:hypothetical protein
MIQYIDIIYWPILELSNILYDFELNDIIYWSILELSNILYHLFEIYSNIRFII